MNPDADRQALYCARPEAVADGRGAASLFDRAVLNWVQTLSPVGMILTDERLLIRCWNGWMEKHTGRAGHEVAGQHLFDVFPEAADPRTARFFDSALKGRPAVLSYGLHHHLFAMAADPAHGGEGWMPQAAMIFPLYDGPAIIGTLTRIEDVGGRVRREAELNATIAEREQALQKVKSLSGMLPICSHCKKIRDDQGYWQQVESYVQDHSEAEFSHSICPSCARRLYPDMDLYPDPPKPEDI